MKCDSWKLFLKTECEKDARHWASDHGILGIEIEGEV